VSDAVTRSLGGSSPIGRQTSTQRRTGALLLSPDRSSPAPPLSATVALSLSMQSGVAPVAPIVASLASAQPGVEDADHVLQTLRAADRDESLTAADSAGAS
jgi:hypothetical protein